MDLNYITNADNKAYLVSYLPDNSKLPTDDESNQLKSLLQGTVYLLSKDRILIGEAIEKNTPVYSFLQSPNEAFYDDMELVENFYEGAFEIKGPTINRKNTGILSNRRKELTSKERNYSIEMEKNIIKIINLFQAILLLLKGKNSSLTQDQIKLIKKDYSLQDFDPVNEDPANEDPKYIQLAEKKITDQNDTIESLTKIKLSMSYYALNSVINPKIYNDLIDTEIFKAVSLTINSDLLKDITLKNSCNVPRTVSTLNSLISNMYDDPEIVDKLIDSYDKANALFLEKIKTYITILQNMEDKDIIKYIDIDPKTIITQYESYIRYISDNKDKLSKKIMKIVEDELQAETRKSERGSRGNLQKSHVDVSDIEQRLAGVDAEISAALQARSQSEEELEELELTTQAQQPSLQGPASKTKKSIKAIKDIFKFLKKNITTIGVNIQNLTKKKQGLEIKISSKTKIFGLETYRNLIDILKGRSQPTQGGGKYKFIKNKTRKNKRKKYITKRRRINNKKSIRKNRKHKNKRLTKRRN